MMKVVGLQLLAVSVWQWLCVFLPRLRGRWKPGLVRTGMLTSVAFALMFGAVGTVFVFGDWLIPQDELPWFIVPFFVGWLMAMLGNRQDCKAFESAQSQATESSRSGGPLP
jgi:hypothetical protein